MRRLGFLEVLLSNCINEYELMSANELGKRLGAWAQKNQDDYIEILRVKRNLEKEVGKISEKTASRYVKYATEIGFLTQGTDKRLTDRGRLFQSFHVKDFLISESKGQQILLIQTLLERDKLFFVNFVKKIAKSDTLSKSEIFRWFSEKCIPMIINKLDRINDDKLIKRLTKSRKQFTFQSKEGKKLGYDKIKHMVDTRIENLVDVSVINKDPHNNYVANELTKILAESFREGKNEQKVLFQAMAKYLKISKIATKKQLVLSYIKQYELLANPPIESVYLPTLHYCILIDALINQNCIITQEEIEKFEEELFKKHYGMAVFFA